MGRFARNAAMVAGLLFMLSSTDALACMCSIFSTTEDALKTTPYVFKGKVVEILDADQNEPAKLRGGYFGARRILRIQVLDRVKGDVPDELLASFLQQDGINCGANYDAGDVLFFGGSEFDSDDKSQSRIPAANGKKARIDVGGACISMDLNGWKNKDYGQLYAAYKARLKDLETDNSPDGLLKLARFHLDYNDLRTAESLLLSYLRERPKDLPVTLLIANTHYNQETYDRALASYRAALALSPNHAEALRGQALSLVKLGRISELPAGHKDFRGLQMEGLTLAGHDLKGFDFSNAKMVNADFTGVDLTGARLDGMKCSRCTFAKADLSGISGEGAQLQGIESSTILTGAKLRKAKLSGPRGEKGQILPLDNPNLKGAILTEAQLGELVISGDQLRGANLTGAKINQGSLAGADLRSTILRDVTIGNVDFSGADLHGVDFGKANLSAARPRDVRDKFSDFSGADLRGAKLAGVNLTNALYDCKTRWPEGFGPAGAGMSRKEPSCDPAVANRPLKREDFKGSYHALSTQSRDNIVGIVDQCLKTPSYECMVGIALEIAANGGTKDPRGKQYPGNLTTALWEMGEYDGALAALGSYPHAKDSYWLPKNMNIQARIVALREGKDKADQLLVDAADRIGPGKKGDDVNRFAGWIGELVILAADLDLLERAEGLEAMFTPGYSPLATDIPPIYGALAEGWARRGDGDRALTAINRLFDLAEAPPPFEQVRPGQHQHKPVKPTKDSYNLELFSHASAQILEALRDSGQQDRYGPALADVMAAGMDDTDRAQAMSNLVRAMTVFPAAQGLRRFQIRKGQPDDPDGLWKAGMELGHLGRYGLLMMAIEKRRAAGDVERARRDLKPVRRAVLMHAGSNTRGQGGACCRANEDLLAYLAMLEARLGHFERAIETLHYLGLVPHQTLSDFARRRLASREALTVLPTLAPVLDTPQMEALIKRLYSPVHQAEAQAILAQATGTRTQKTKRLNSSLALLPDALARFRSEIDIEVQFDVAHAALAQVNALAEQGRRDQALPILRGLVPHLVNLGDPNKRVDWAVRLSILAHVLGDDALARKILADAPAIIKERTPQAHFRYDTAPDFPAALARAYLHMGDTAKAREQFDVLVKLFRYPQHVPRSLAYYHGLVVARMLPIIKVLEEDKGETTTNR